MRSFVRNSRLNWLMTLKSAATLSLAALVATGCGDEHDFADDFDHLNEASAALEGETGSVVSVATGGPTSGSVSSVNSSGVGGAPGVGGGGPGSVVSTGVGGAGGGSGGGEPGGGPTAFWKFDDCEDGSLDLQDFSGN